MNTNELNAFVNEIETIKCSKGQGSLESYNYLVVYETIMVMIPILILVIAIPINPGMH